MLVQTATYRQSSRVRPEQLEHDPENRLLSRGPCFRLSAESIRDQALAVSGLLTEKVGGPSVQPYLPGQNRTFQPELYRRSVYSFW
jgi:hypothetical protein